MLANVLGFTIRRWSSEQQRYGARSLSLRNIVLLLVLMLAPFNFKRGATFSLNASNTDGATVHDLHVPYVSEIKDFEEFLYFSKYPQLNVRDAHPRTTSL